MNSGKATLLHQFNSSSSVITMERFELPLALPAEERTASGSVIVRGVRIFRAGTFKDSLGVERTWTQEELRIMQENFQRMRESNLLGGIPVREDHSRSVKNIVGWFANVYVDPTDSNFLLGDIEFTEPTAYDKWKRGTFRSRSSEIGLYETNTGQVFYPAVLGLAFVDYGAVEGLYNKEEPKLGTHHYAIVDKENHNMTLEQWLASGRSAEDWVKAVEYAASLEANPPENDPQSQSESDPNPNPAPTPPAPQPQPAPTLPAPQPANHGVGNLTVFQINGQPTTDIGAVQAHITTLEHFRRETVLGIRREFVESLVSSNRLAQTQRDATIEFVNGLTEEQFLSYRQSMENAPAHSLFAQYGNTTDGPQNPQNPGFPSGGDENMTEIEVAEGIVEMHRRSGQSVEFIKATPSYATLAKHNKAPF